MDLNSLPVDTSNPAVRQYLSLIRLQVLTPLSLLINIATLLVCATVAKPTIGGISKQFPTSISPNPALTAIYILAIWIGQVGYCVLLVVARKPETKETIVKGVGLALVFANWFMATWAIAWVLQFFIFATLLQGFLLACLVYSNIALLIYHPPTYSRPFDIALIHAPQRLYLILPLSVLFPYSLFISLGLAYHPDGRDYAAHPWPGFGVVFGTNLLGFLVTLIRGDIVWCVAATWICVSIWSQQPKTVPVHITEILFTVLHPLALLLSYAYAWFHREGRIALPPDREAHGPSGHERLNPRVQNGERQGPTEIDAEALWG